MLPLRYLMLRRTDLVAQSGRQIQVMQKVLTAMNVHIHHVFSDVDGVSAQAIITAVLALIARLETSAPAGLPGGLGKLTVVLALREVCDWGRFENRRQVSSHTGL